MVSKTGIFLSSPPGSRTVLHSTDLLPAAHLRPIQSLDHSEPTRLPACSPPSRAAFQPLPPSLALLPCHQLTLCCLPHKDPPTPSPLPLHHLSSSFCNKTLFLITTFYLHL